MIEPTIRKKIEGLIAEIEAEKNVNIFYACESGSRAWGFPSTDSDYDVRFLYVHPTDWYLSINERRDVIERPIDEMMDISGWDLRKALGLYRKSNPPLMEWLQSPIVYKDTHGIADKMRDLLPQFYSPIACMYHYLSMAEGNVKDYVRGGEVRTKKYFYILRPVLACQWVEAELGAVPTEFEILVDTLVKDAALKRAIDDLLARKKAGEELSRGPRIPVISEFVESEIERLRAQQFYNKKPKADIELLNVVFRDTLKEVWG